MMQYRPFGSLDWNISALGFGCMRLPVQGGAIDEPEAARMLHTAIDGGVNYIDTAWPYHDGESEPLVGRVLAQSGPAGSYRSRVRVATKLPSWLVTEAKDLDFYLEEQLRRLQTEHIEFYLLHTLNRKYWDTLVRVDVLEWADRKVREGKIGRLGFSFHDEYPVFEEILNARNWDFCQIQYNYMNIIYQAGRKGLRAAAARGIPVVVMEPLLGGVLAQAPASVQAIWDTAPVQRSAAEWAFQWLWDQPEVAVVLSGMSTLEQVKQNLESAGRSGMESLSQEERKTVASARRALEERATIPCTTCGYCMPCPHGVNIPRNFMTYNNAVIYDIMDKARGQYRWLKKGFDDGIFDSDIRAAACIQCGECEPKCPQNIKISSLMPKVHEVLSGAAETVD